MTGWWTDDEHFFFISEEILCPYRNYCLRMLRTEETLGNQIHFLRAARNIFRLFQRNDSKMDCLWGIGFYWVTWIKNIVLLWLFCFYFLKWMPLTWQYFRTLYYFPHLLRVVRGFSLVERSLIKHHLLSFTHTSLTSDTGQTHIVS